MPHKASAVEAQHTAHHAHTVHRGRHPKDATPCSTPPTCTLKAADDEIMAIVDIVRERVTKDLCDKISELFRHYDKAFGEFDIAERMEIINAVAVEYIADAGSSVLGPDPAAVVKRLVITRKHHAKRIATTLLK